MKPIQDPSTPAGHTTAPLHAEGEALQVSASGNAILTSKPSTDMVSAQRPVSPCPRCHSLDTKFCYFNNHNAKQPRHFCRNCQRYWTAGGALRNVPVGAGRRKYKTSSNSTVPKLHPEENDPAIASKMCHSSSSKTVNRLPGIDCASPLSFQSVTAMSTHSHGHHMCANACEGIREAMVNKPATESGFLHNTQAYAQQKQEALSSLQQQYVGFHGIQKDAGQVEHWDETPSAEAASLALHTEKVENHVPVPPPVLSLPLPSQQSIEEMVWPVKSSTSMCPTEAKRMDIAHPLVWLEQLAKAIKSECMQGAYGYGNASLAWSHAVMRPWHMPYATHNNGLVCSDTDRDTVSAAWDSAVTATAANILQTSPLWSPYGWGRDASKPDHRLSILGKRGRSSSDHEQEPLCIPKTLKIGDPEEAMHSSILMTLGLSSLSASSPASITGFFNASLQLQPKANDQHEHGHEHKPMVDASQQHRHGLQQLSHMNPIAQARSLGLQERS